MRELTKNEMLMYFEEINRHLARLDKHGEILIAGGAALAMVFNARNSTYDIDAIFHPAEDMRKITKDIAIKYDLPEDWLNDGIKGYITDKMKQEIYLKFPHLTVANIDAVGLLAMKLTSARVDTKDMEDSIFLMKSLNICEEKELFDIIEKHVYPNQQTIASKYFTKEAYERYVRLHKTNDPDTE